MENRIFMRFLIIMVMSIVFSSLTWAAGWHEQPLLPWESDALKAFEQEDYDKVIAMCKAQEEDPNGNRRLLTYYAHAQKYYMGKNRESAIYYKRHFHDTLQGLSGANLTVLMRLTSMQQVAWNKKINSIYRQTAFENTKKDKYIGSLLYYLMQPNADEEVFDEAVKGLKAILTKKRDIVFSGGSLNREDRKWMEDPELIMLLTKKIGEKANPMTGLMSKLPAIAHKKVIGGAQACLMLIEEPTLPFLEKAAAAGNPAAAATISLVKEARGKRLGEYPNSTWYSATGQ
jgi:hypothetical protein